MTQKKRYHHDSSKIMEHNFQISNNVPQEMLSMGAQSMGLLQL
jgi:hypothetical protein